LHIFISGRNSNGKHVTSCKL